MLYFKIPKELVALKASTQKSSLMRMTIYQWMKHINYTTRYVEQTGIPVLFLHGGPGGGINLTATFFNPEKYRVILFSQRGSGKVYLSFSRVMILTT